MFKLARRAAECAILLVALYAAVFVPLGEKTLWQHARAVFSTPEAKDAGREIQQAGGKMLQELRAFEPRPVRGEPEVPQLATPTEFGPFTSDPDAP